LTQLNMSFTPHHQSVAHLRGTTGARWRTAIVSKMLDRVVPQ
jgi:hypothetical protein